MNKTLYVVHLDFLNIRNDYTLINCKQSKYFSYLCLTIECIQSTKN